MIEIKPPDDWDPDASETKENLLVPPPRAAEKSSNFEDVENLLDESRDAQIDAIRNVRRQPASQDQSRSKSKRSPKKQRLAPQTLGAEQIARQAQPVLPTEAWTAESTKKRKRLTMAVAGVVGLVLITFTLIAATINLTKPVAEIAPPNAPADSSDKPENAAVESKLTDKDESSEVQSPADSALTENAANNLPTSDPLVSETPPKGPIDQLTVSEVEGPVKTGDPGTTSQPTELNEPKTENSAPLPSIASPIGNKSGNRQNVATRPALPPPNGLDSMQSELGELSALLEQSGTSILKVQDLAEANRDEQLIGMPKYFVRPPEPERLDIAKQMSLPCDGINYEDTRLITVLRELSMLIGVPFTLDTNSVLATGGELNPKINLELKGGDFEEVIHSIVEPLGLTASVFQDRGVVIHASSLGTLIEKKHSLPDFPQPNREARERFVAILKGLVFPQSWLREQSPATIEVVGDELVVSNTDIAHAMIATLVAKIEASLKLTQHPADEEARKILTTKWDSVSAKLQQPAGLVRTLDDRLEKRLDELHQATGITVLLDWDNLVPMGWTPLTKLPGHINEPNAEEILKQIARAMDLTVLAIDETTMQITTFDKAARAVDLEVYHFGKILAGPLNEQLALRLIRETLGVQLQSSQVRYIYEPKCQCLVLVAPQFLQKQVSSVVQQLEGLR